MGAALQGHRGSYWYDDEGTPRHQYSTDSRWSTGGAAPFLRETAGKLNETPTGNARCLNYHYSPLVRMTNTWIGRGDTPRERIC